MLAAGMSIAEGLRVGRYEVLRKLGQGGFGVLYVARDLELDREVALKFLRPEHLTRPQLVQRFLQEARSAAKIDHAGIVTVFECGQVADTNTRADGTVYIAMELLKGESLGARLKRERRLAPALAIGLCRQVTAALGAAHRAGIVHRDLKPDNIFLVPDPAVRGGERVKILDFGIAKLADGQLSGNVRTHSAMVLGTPMYMSPEQCKSSAKVDHRSDIYATGCILFELLTGQTPYDGDAGELIAKHQLAAVPAPRAVLPELSQGLDMLLTQMLAKSPDDRPGSMELVDDALAACEGTASKIATPAPLRPDRDSMPTATTMFQGEHTHAEARKPPPWKLIGGAAGVIVLGIVLGIAATRSGDDAQDPPAKVATVVDTTPSGSGSDVVVAPLPPPPTQPTVSAPPAGDDLFLECSKLAVERYWTGLLTCSERLASVDPAKAAELRAKAVMETKAESAARNVEDALQARNYDDALEQLAKIPEDSVYKRDTATRVSEVMEAVENAKSAGGGKSAAVPPQAAPPDCDADALRQKGDDHLQTGMDAAALAAFEASMRCRPNPALYRRAFLAACRSNNAAKANVYYPKLPSKDAAALSQMCARVGIKLDPHTPDPYPAKPDCDADALRQKGDDHLQSGMDAAALAAFEASMRCRPDPTLYRRAFLAACRSKNAAKAKAYFPKLPAKDATPLAQMCIRNGIQVP